MRVEFKGKVAAIELAVPENSALAAVALSHVEGKVTETGSAFGQAVSATRFRLLCKEVIASRFQLGSTVKITLDFEALPPLPSGIVSGGHS